jgi:NADH:ubiquinone oxidoreductase subunit C
MNDETLINSLKQSADSFRLIEITNPAPRRIFVKVNREDLLATVQYLKDNFNFTYLATITGVDKGENFELLYHFANEYTCLSVRTSTPRAEPKIKSICSIIPGAILYERELPDMFGIIVEDIPDSRSLLLPDGWPIKVYPLRKDWQYERPAEIIPGEK